MPLSQPRSHVLVVEDDRKLAAALASGLEAEGYRVTSASSAEEGFFLLHSERPDLLVFDVALPQRNGLDLLRQLRKERNDVRVLMLTSHSTTENRVVGLKAGADDYLGKPFSFPELLARIEAQLRRILPEPQSDRICVADLCLNLNYRTGMRAGAQIELSQREFNLLLYLTENAGRIVSREMLARDVWHETSRFTPLDNVIDVQIGRLRRKIDDGHPIKLLQTVRGLGFTLPEPAP